MVGPAKERPIGHIRAERRLSLRREKVSRWGSAIDSCKTGVCRESSELRAEHLWGDDVRRADDLPRIPTITNGKLQHGLLARPYERDLISCAAHVACGVRQRSRIPPLVRTGLTHRGRYRFLGLRSRSRAASHDVISNTNPTNRP